MAQQTAVEWLQDKLNNVKPTQFCSIETIKEWVEQAKQMEKEQTKHAFIIGGQQGFLSASEEEYMNFEQYYNEIYLK